jgi:hypothetical protein
MFGAGWILRQGFVRKAAGRYGHQGCIFMYGLSCIVLCFIRT